MQLWTILSEVPPSKDMAEQDAQQHTAGTETPVTKARYQIYWASTLQNIYNSGLYLFDMPFTFLSDVKEEDTQSTHMDCVSGSYKYKPEETNITEHISKGKIFNQGQ